MRKLLTVALLVAFATSPIVVVAHEGHDHGAKPSKSSKKVKKGTKKHSQWEAPGIRFTVTPAA